MKCFFDGTHGVGGCVGEVKEAGGAADRVVSGPFMTTQGYCERHRYGNMERARWEGQRGAPKARKAEKKAA